MTSTKSFSTKNTTILIVAVFSLAISIGLSQVSSALAQTNMVNCSTEVEDESNDSEVNNARSCEDEKEAEEENDESDSTQVNTISSSTSYSSTSSNNEEDDDEGESERNDNVATKPQNVVSSGPASASPEDNIIKPINLNKGLVSDKPLKTNNVNNNNNQDEEIDSIKVIEDEFEFKKQMDKTSDVSEIYKSFDLPYTALYKNP